MQSISIAMYTLVLESEGVHLIDKYMLFYFLW